MKPKDLRLHTPSYISMLAKPDYSHFHLYLDYLQASLRSTHFFTNPHNLKTRTLELFCEVSSWNPCCLVSFILSILKPQQEQYASLLMLGNVPATRPLAIGVHREAEEPQTQNTWFLSCSLLSCDSGGTVVCTYTHTWMRHTRPLPLLTWWFWASNIQSQCAKASHGSCCSINPSNSSGAGIM